LNDELIKKIIEKVSENLQEIDKIAGY